jgi:hypothetical protein
MMTNTYKNFVEKRKIRSNLGDMGVDERMMLKLMLNKQHEMWNGFIWLRIGSICVLLWTR